MSNILHLSTQPTRSKRAQWAFLEAGLAHDTVEYDLFTGAHKVPAFQRLNPIGYTPAAEIDGEPMIESSAIALWAAHQTGTLLPPVSSPQYRAVLQWSVFAPAELDHRINTILAHTRFRPPAARNPALVAELREELTARFDHLADTLKGRRYLGGDGFTVADVIVGHSLGWAKMIGQLENEALLGYLSDLETRPAFLQAYGGPLPFFPDPHAQA